MIECTFAFNNKSQNTILTDERALAIRVSNILLNRQTGLPNDYTAFYDIKSHMQEFAGNGDLLALSDSIKAHLTSYISLPYTVEVEVTKDTNKNDLRKTLNIVLTIGNSESGSGVALIYSGSATGDGLKLSKLVTL